jgi:hypothetical protein
MKTEIQNGKQPEDRRKHKAKQNTEKCKIRNSHASNVSINKTGRAGWANHAAYMRKMTNSCKTVSIKQEESAWQDDIKMYLRNKRCDGEEWAHLAQKRSQWRTR